MPLDTDTLRNTFPILGREVNNRPLVYLDNAATTQKPASVINRIRAYYEQENSNIHRGAHFLSQQATETYEQARENVRSLINAGQQHEIIFTRGTTESINLVAHSYGKKFLSPGDEILISAMEHHSNIVPWQVACQEHQATLRVIDMNQEGELDMTDLKNKLTDKTRLVAITHVSNVLGTINPVREIIDLAHQQDIPVLVDGAQATPHMAVDVQELDCDFYCFSAHKMYGPMGVGVLYGKEEWLTRIPPYQSGGEMIKEVSFSGTSYNELPFKFEAGTPNVADVIGLDAAIHFISDLGYENIAGHEEKLLAYTREELGKLENIRFFGNAKRRANVVSFLFDDIHPFDTGTILDKMGVAVRTGHHCAQPVMDFYQIPGTVRVSLAVYNTREEIDTLIEALRKVREMFA
ncbi:MAG: cysteine desulfurase [Bacteroidales bacterium]